MSATLALVCVAALIGIGALALALARISSGSRIIYAASMAVSTLALACAVVHLVTRADPSTLILPIGIPGLGAHFRIDALAAFFLAVVNFGAAVASLYALGYGEHET